VARAIVLDASALLAKIFLEPGHEGVDIAGGDAMISTVNLAEVLSRLVQGSPSDLHRVLADLDDAGVTVVPFDLAYAKLAAELLPRTQHAGLSLGDCAGLALAIARGVPVLTADRAWAGLGLPVEVELIR
jgi:ribonuclease VapC